MYESLKLFQTAADMAHHAGARQAVVARNVANADTPNYQAASIAPFSETYKTMSAGPLKATRPGHVANTMASQSQARERLTLAEPAPNGNTVSIEDEMLSSVAISREHNRALAIYRHGMTIIRTVIGR